jgi:hypothetical protein
LTHNPQFGSLATPAAVVAASVGGTLGIYDGIQPAGPATAITTQQLLVSVPLPAFAAPLISGTAYSAVAGPFPPVLAQQTGTATWFRVTGQSGGAVFDGAAGASGADLVLDPVLIVGGDTVSISSLTVGGQVLQNVTGIASVTVPPPPVLAPPVASGYTGTEPTYLSSIEWPTGSGIHWENENWGSGSGWPAAANLSVDANGYLNLRTAYVGGQLTGAEADSVRGDLGLSGNESRWGYGTYQWVIGTDLTTIDPMLVLGLFTFQGYGSHTTTPANANGKGGPLGQKELDFEFSNWSPEGVRPEGIFAQMGFYADTSAGITSGPPVNAYGSASHVMTGGSQWLLPPGNEVITVQFTWLPASITWSIWLGTGASGDPDYTLTMTHGQKYSYTEPYGGNVYAGTVSIPATGGQQVIMNLWSQGQDVEIANTTVIIRSFSYTPA